MSRKHLIYTALLVGLLLLNAGRSLFVTDREATISETSGRGLIVDTTVFELGSLAEDAGDLDVVTRDLFAPVRPPVAQTQQPSKPAPPISSQPQGASKEKLARQNAQDELDKFALAGVLVKDSEITAMLVKEENHFSVKVGERVGKDVLIQKITFDDVVLVNQEWGVERILTIENIGPGDQD